MRYSHLSLEWIDDGYDIITLTASCGLMLKFEWPLLNPENENQQSNYNQEHTFTSHHTFISHSTFH